ncbi:hypothetical protein GCM10008986_20790 [Salinibacillus aidingensis]|uniref:Uncharacterized protein n=1 Tax=Salinibacillus aidingensis TaxID=237684 RepID=A0ABN1BB92_9BACI
MIGAKNKEKRNPPESEVHRRITTKLEVKSATAFPMTKNGTPAQIKKVRINKTNAIITNIKFFLNTFE